MSLRTIAFLLALVSGQALPLPAQQNDVTAAPPKSASAVNAFFSDYIQAFNAQNMKGLATLWTEDGEHIDRKSGDRAEGRDRILADLKQVFETHPDIRLAGQVQRVRMITADVAQVEGLVTLTRPDVDPDVSRFSALLVKSDAGWALSRVEESPVPVAASAAQALQELSWMIGEWKDESAEATVKFSVRWAGEQSFLIRSYSVEVGGQLETNGMQVIGWDPRAKQFRSWSFNSDGSFGNGSWSKNEDDWIIKSTQTLADGSVASGTYVMSPIDEKSFTMKLFGRQVAGELLPSTEPVTVVRVEEPKVEVRPKNGTTRRAGDGTPQE